jgi:hypothetical protein
MNENTKLKEDFSNEGMYHEIIEETRPELTYKDLYEFLKTIYPKNNVDLTESLQDFMLKPDSGITISWCNVSHVMWRLIDIFFHDESEWMFDVFADGNLRILFIYLRHGMGEKSEKVMDISFSDLKTDRKTQESTLEWNGYKLTMARGHWTITGPDNTYMRRDGYSSLSITENRHYAVCWFKGKMLERIIDNRMRNF